MPTQTLHPRYQILQSIYSIEHRVHLSNLLPIFMADLSSIPDDRLTDSKLASIQRFFDYLDRSCASVTVINRRAKWLSKYLQIIYSDLHQTSPLPDNLIYADKDLPADHFFSKTIALTEQICIYRVFRPADAYTKEIELDLLNQILESSRHKLMDFTDINLVQLDRDLQTVTDWISSKNICHAHNDDHQTDLIQQLHSLAYRFARV